MKKRITRFLSCAVLATLSLPALAHHGWSWYGNTAFELEAVVVEKRFGNPHDRLVLEDKQGQRWNVLLSPPSRSRRAGLDEDKLAIGDQVRAYGHRRSEGDRFEMKTERLLVNETLYNLYPDRD